jgi:serine/threonine protein kinase/formylglycine-generating enzyme required for sulfatase activity/dienelactone hydrolase
MRCPSCGIENLEDSKFCRKCATALPGVEASFTRTIAQGPAELASGSVIAGHYKIDKVLGRGGMGVVYLADDTRLKRPVALKFLPPGLALDEDIRKRFMIEAQAAAALSHPNICTIYEVDDQAEKAFISMEYIEGESLREKVLKGPLPFDRVLNIALQVCAGLDEAHKKGIVHRDVKSANIMLTANGQAKIMDFGLAKVAGAAMVTKEGSTMGTAAYMSPEQAKGESVDARTDIWSMGVVLYELASGKLPFRGDLESAVIHNIIYEEPKPLKAIVPKVPEEFERIVKRALKKKADDRYGSAAEMLADLRKLHAALEKEKAGVFNLRSFLRIIRKPLVAFPAALVLIALGFLIYSIINRQGKIRWARATLLPEIEQLIMAEGAGRDNLIDAYELVRKAERSISGDPKLSELTSKCAVTISVETDPPGARVCIKKYSAPDSAWNDLGTTPIKNIRLPMGIFRWKIAKEGYETVQAAAFTYKRDESKKYFNVPDNLRWVLDKKGSLPPGMVRVAGGQVQGIGRIDDFFIDRFEVTNRQFKEFVDQGGYQRKEYWKFPFVQDGKALSFEEATARFVDQTGRPGPSTWQAGVFPQGHEDYPVSGVSWYEAAAFAEFAGKSLPSSSHWGVARGELTPLYQSGFLSILYPLSNFLGEGPAQAGKYQGMTAYGAYDMAGNVREWCWNETAHGRLVRGGAWNDINYMFYSLSQAPPFDRSPQNGFRCAKYLDPQKVPEAALAPIEFYGQAERGDLYHLRPVPDSVFQVYKDQFSYDKKDLNARVESTDERARDWTKQKITFDSASADERMTAYLFLPKISRPPYQTVIYFPGSSAFEQESSQDLEKYVWFEVDLSFLLQNGRAVLFPIFTGTFERRGQIPEIIPPDTRFYTEYYIRVFKELERSIDYLESRPDIDRSKIAYMGFSWGGWLGTMIPAVEERLKVNIIKAGGLRNRGRPEINPINYVSRVRLPTLMLNGKYDMDFPYETSAKPMFDLLGTPKKDKVQKLYDTDHFIPHNEFIKETLAWLDKYLGPVK